VAEPNTEVVRTMAEVSVLTDEDLMVRAAEGSVTAFEALVRRWDRSMLRYFERFTGSAEWSNDLRQELFFRLYRSRGTYRPGGRFSSWLYRMAHNVAVDVVCRKGSLDQTALDEEETIDPVTPEAPARVLERELGVILKRAIQRLSVEERTVLILKHDERMTFEEIAEVLDMPLSTVKSRLYRSFTKLRRYLRQAGVDLSAVL